VTLPPRERLTRPVITGVSADTVPRRCMQHSPRRLVTKVFGTRNSVVDRWQSARNAAPFIRQGRGRLTQRGAVTEDTVLTIGVTNTKIRRALAIPTVTAVASDSAFIIRHTPSALELFGVSGDTRHTPRTSHQDGHKNEAARTHHEITQTAPAPSAPI
jgi:hypothetical protein